MADNNFPSTKEEEIKSAKIITKDREYLTPTHPLEFNGASMELNSNSIVLTKKSHVGGIFLVTGHIADCIGLNGIRKKKLSPKEQYLA